MISRKLLDLKVYVLSNMNLPISNYKLCCKTRSLRIYYYLQLFWYWKAGTKDCLLKGGWQSHPKDIDQLQTYQIHVHPYPEEGTAWCTYNSNLWKKCLLREIKFGEVQPLWDPSCAIPPRCYVPEKWHLITYVSWNEFTL